MPFIPKQPSFPIECLKPAGDDKHLVGCDSKDPDATKFRVQQGGHEMTCTSLYQAERVTYLMMAAYRGGYNSRVQEAEDFAKAHFTRM